MPVYRSSPRPELILGDPSLIILPNLRRRFVRGPIPRILQLQASSLVASTISILCPSPLHLCWYLSNIRADVTRPKDFGGFMLLLCVYARFVYYFDYVPWMKWQDVSVLCFDSWKEQLIPFWKDKECLKEMNVKGVDGQAFTRLDAIKQSVLMFMDAKLSINADHRFAFCAIEKSTYWLQKEFSSTLESALTSFRGIRQHSSSDQADLTQLFRAAAHEAKKSRAQNRILRLILIYCRSSVQPHHQWPAVQKLFTLYVMYVHDKPGSENCPQKVYDALVDTLEQVSEYEGYIFETSQGLPRILFRHMCVLLSHPQQRCIQDDIDIPKSLTVKTAAVDRAACGEIVPVSSQELRGAEIEQLHLLNEADPERLQADLSGVGADLEMAKGEAADAFEEGYYACLRKFAETGVDSE